MASNQEEEVLGKAYDGRLMRRLLTYLRPYKWHVVVALAAIILKSGADVLGPFLTKIAIDKYLAKSPNSHSWIGDRLSDVTDDRHRADWRALRRAALFTFTLEFIQTYLMQWTGQKVMFDLRRQIFRHLQHMHVGFFDKNPVGRLVTRVTTDVDALNEMFTAGVVSIFEDVFVLAGIIAHHDEDELEAGADYLCRASADRVRDQDLPRQGARFLPAHPHGDCADQLLSAGSRLGNAGAAAFQSREARLQQIFRDQRLAHGGVQRRHPGLRGVLPGG